MKKDLMLLLIPVILLIFSCNKDTKPEQFGLEDIKKGMEESKKIVVARVNGEEITMHALVREMNLIASAYIKEEAPSDDLTKKIKKETLERLIAKELIIQEARRNNIKIPDEKIQAVIENIKKSLGSESAYKAYLSERGLSEKELKREIERSHLFEIFTALHIYGKIKVEEDEIKKRFDELKKKNKDLRFEDLKSVIEKQIRGERGREELMRLVRELKERSVIEVYQEG